MKNLSSRDRSLVIAGGAVLVILALAFGVALPAADRMAGLSRDLENLRSKLEQAAEMYAQAPAMEGEIRTYRDELATLAHAEGEIIPDIVREIESRATRLGLTLLSVRPTEPVPMDGCLRHPITVQIESDCGRIVKLLCEFEERGSGVWVEGVEVNAESGVGGDLRATVSIAVYTLLPASEESDDEPNA